jgi:hypothetical protein
MTTDAYSAGTTRTITVASTFTSDLVRDSLLATLAEHGISSAAEGAPYGQVGLMVTEIAGERLRASAMVLSCRVLGRGVEEALLRHVAAFADEQSCGIVELAVTVTPRNEPTQQLVRQAAGTALEERNGQLISVLSPAVLVARVGAAQERPKGGDS